MPQVKVFVECIDVDPDIIYSQEREMNMYDVILERNERSLGYVVQSSAKFEVILGLTRLTLTKIQHRGSDSGYFRD